MELQVVPLYQPAGYQRLHRPPQTPICMGQVRRQPNGIVGRVCQTPRGCSETKQKKGQGFRKDQDCQGTATETPD